MALDSFIHLPLQSRIEAFCGSIHAESYWSIDFKVKGHVYTVQCLDKQKSMRRDCIYKKIWF